MNLAVLASAGPIVAFFSFSTTNSPFMCLAQRSGVCDFGASGDGLSVANAAPPEHDSQTRLQSRADPGQLPDGGREASASADRGELAAARSAINGAGGAERAGRKGPRPAVAGRGDRRRARRGALCAGSPWKATSWAGT